MNDGEVRDKLWIDDVFTVLQDAADIMEAKGESERDILSIQAVMLSLAFQFCWTKQFVHPTTKEEVKVWSEVRKILIESVDTITAMKTGSSGILSGSDDQRAGDGGDLHTSSGQALADRFLELATGSAATRAPDHFQPEGFHKISSALASFLEANPVSRPWKRHPAFRAFEDAFCSEIEALNPAVLKELSFSELATKVAAAIDATISPEWIEQAKLIARGLASAGLPSECKCVFADIPVLEDFMCRRTRYIASCFTELCTNVLCNVGPFKNVCSGFRNSELSDVLAMRLEKSIPSHAGSLASAWRDILMELARTPDLSKSVEAVIVKHEAAASPQQVSPSSAATSVSAEGDRGTTDQQQKNTLFCKVDDLNGFVGGPGLSPDLLAVAHAAASAAAALDSDERVPLVQIPFQLSLLVLKRVCLKVESFL
jgi:hypothetical protein